ncbi:ATP-dependent DNA ligase [Piscinibacter sakaiensis]|uniref:ATP-dependent DNA ligase n=1 Tax=Piscinibacter sakaiensis TaxID=1547922 RepID=UPI003AAE9E45
MRRFAELFQALDASTSTADKVAALRRYLEQASPADAAWAVYFLAGGRPRRTVPTSMLRGLATELAGIDDWLFEECYQAVGDLGETIALILPPAERHSDRGLADWIENGLLPLRDVAPAEQAAAIAGYWNELDSSGRFLLSKLIGGGFRVGVSKLLVQRALAEFAGLDPKLVAQRMIGYTDKQARPDVAAFQRLIAAESGDTSDAAGAAGNGGQPFPFFLAHPLDLPLAEFEPRLGSPADWQIEWKYDGIRAQIVRHGGQVWIWTRGEELVTERFPELQALAQDWPDGSIVDGEIVVWKNDAPASFALLQQRIGRKTLGRKILTDAPVDFIAYDLLADGGVDLRSQPQQQRRSALERFAAEQNLRIAPLVEGSDWAALAAVREQSRQRGVEGLMLKHRLAAYGQGRRKQPGLAGGTWWKWKIDPLSVDAILIYAQAGHGRRASVYTDYTFAVWNRPPVDAAEAAAVVEAIAARRPPVDGGLQLVPFAKAYSGLSDAEFASVDRIIRATSVDKFGPVRSVRPSLLFELGFEGINRSARHKSGIAVRFPRMLRLRTDKPLHEADSLAELEALLAMTSERGNAAPPAPLESGG